MNLINLLWKSVGYFCMLPCFIVDSIYKRYWKTFEVLLKGFPEFNSDGRLDTFK